jgi:hypothetical protein
VVDARLGHKPSRADRPTLRIFIGRKFKAQTHIVRTDGKQKPIPEALRYSTIADLIGCA